MNILIVGIDSNIGAELYRNFRIAGWQVYGTTRGLNKEEGQIRHLDLSNLDDKWSFPEDIDITFLCAAVTNLSDCKINPDYTRFINVEQTGLLARLLLAKGSRIVFFSTNLVFSGEESSIPEQSSYNPLTEYGRQKADAEERLMALSSDISIVRMTKVITPGRGRFESWRRSLMQGKVINPLSDLKCSPILIDSVVEVVDQIIKFSKFGIWQISGERDVTYADIAFKMAQYLGVDVNLVKPVSAIDLNFNLEASPKNTTLSCKRIQTEIGINLPSFDQVVQKICLRDIV